MFLVFSRLLPGTFLHNLCMDKGCRLPDFSRYPSDKLSQFEKHIELITEAQDAAFAKMSTKAVDVFKFNDVFKVS